MTYDINDYYNWLHDSESEPGFDRMWEMLTSQGREDWKRINGVIDE